MLIKVPPKLCCHNYIPGQSVWPLQEWFGWRTRYEELFRSLLCSSHHRIFHFCTITACNQAIFLCQPWICYWNSLLCHHTSGKPYRKAYMNHLPTLLLSNFMIICYVLSSGFHTQLITWALLAMPITAFIIAIVTRIVYNMFRSDMCHKLKLLCGHRTNVSTQNSTVNAPTSTQPLILLSTTFLWLLKLP